MRTIETEIDHFNEPLNKLALAYLERAYARYLNGEDDAKTFLLILAGEKSRWSSRREGFQNQDVLAAIVEYVRIFGCQMPQLPTDEPYSNANKLIHDAFFLEA